MAFWNLSTLEPKRKHRWLLYLNNSKIPSYAVKVTDKPSFTINETEHNFFGHKFYYPGQVAWNEISVTLVDPIHDDTSKALLTVLENSGYQPPTEHENDMLNTVSKADSVKALGPTIKLEQVTGVDQKNKVVEEWELHNPWIKEVNFGDLDYASDDMVEITLSIRYDWATYLSKRP